MDPLLQEAIALRDAGQDLAAVRKALQLATTLGPVALQGADEGPRLDAAVELVRGMAPRLPQAARPLAGLLLWRAGFYDEASALGSIAEIGRWCSSHGLPGILLRLLARVETDADRVELLHQHRLWGETVERAASEQPLAPCAAPASDGCLRLGLLSSDLRTHAVGYFAQPLFRDLDPRFELYAYSGFRGAADPAQEWMASRAKAFRILPAGDREAAQVIAADGLDILVEIGGPTSQNTLGVMAYRPARLQASWLGYPHSTGLLTIDYFVGDPWMAPARRELLLEAPLLLPKAAFCMAPAAFHDDAVMEPTPPVVRKGFITFGTANDPYKYNPRLLRTWARVVAAVPGARFLVVRPEAGALSFRENLTRIFAGEGVEAERLEFRALRGGVRLAYADMDIALDCFPVTGGTTTCDALWMGVPTVTLAGPAVYERLSLTILQNAGLGDLCTTTEADYVRTAVGLARDVERLAELRRTMRARVRSHPIGQADAFARDFYDLMARAIAQAR